MVNIYLMIFLILGAPLCASESELYGLNVAQQFYALNSAQQDVICCCVSELILSWKNRPQAIARGNVSNFEHIVIHYGPSYRPTLDQQLHEVKAAKLIEHLFRQIVEERTQKEIEANG